MIRVNLLKALGGDVGYLGELAFARAFPRAARGKHVAIILEGLYSAPRVKTATNKMPEEKAGDAVSRHLSTDWPIHKSWIVPVVDRGEPAVLIEPPKGTVRYIGRDDGKYAYLLKQGLAELVNYVAHGTTPKLLKGWEIFTAQEIEAAALLEKRLENPQFAAVAIDTIKDVDFLIVQDGEIYHVEVKTTHNPTETKLRKKRAIIQRRQQTLEKLGLKPALAVVIPKDNWEIEIYIETG